MPQLRTYDKRWLAVLPLSIVVGFLFDKWNVPAAWILAAILCAGGCALLTRRELVVRLEATTFAKALIAMVAAVPLTTTPPRQLVHFIFPGLMVAAVTLAMSCAGGLILARTRRGDISPETGILSLLAGGASIMPVLAQELGADYRYVALSQYLRLLAVSFTLPLLTPFLGLYSQGTAAQSDPGTFTWTSWLVMILIIVFGEPIGKLLRLPAAGFLAPLFLTLTALFLLPEGTSLLPPDAVRVAAFLAIGWMAGGGLSTTALTSFARQLPITIAFIAILFTGCAAMAWVLHAWLGVSYLDAYLATTPGGLETVLALAGEANSGPVVASVQIIRLLFVLIIAGWLPQLIHTLLSLAHKPH